MPHRLAIAAVEREGDANLLAIVARDLQPASLEDMIEATGWLPHTVRAAMTGLRKRGFEITRHVEGNTTVWAVAAASSEVPA